MKRQIWTLLIVCGSFPLIGQTTWDGSTSTDWDDASNWSAGIPDAADAVTIPICSGFPNCPSILNGTTASVLSITSNGTLTVDLGGTVTGAGGDLLIGNGTNDGSLINNGTISGFDDIKNKGAAAETTAGEPSIVSSGSISCVKFQGGSNEGVGLVTINSGGSITTTGEIHIDSQLINNGTMTVGSVLKLHGGVVSGSGDINTDAVEFDDQGAPNRSGGLQGTLSINNTTGGCSGSGAPEVEFYSKDGAGVCDNANDDCTFSDLLNTGSNFDIDNTISSCGESAGTALPVVLIHFGAESYNDRVKLIWNTASELNNEKFIVEKSGDGKTYNTIGEVTGHGTTTEPQEYQFEDFGLASSYNYYRLKQMDFDGRFEYSTVIFMTIDQDQFAEFAVFPNPIKNGQISFPQHSGVVSEIVIHDLQGKVKMKRISSNLGKVDVSGLSNGMYFLKLKQGNQTKTARFFVDK